MNYGNVEVVGCLLSVIRKSEYLFSVNLHNLCVALCNLFNREVVGSKLWVVGCGLWVVSYPSSENLNIHSR